MPAAVPPAGMPPPGGMVQPGGTVQPVGMVQPGVIQRLRYIDVEIERLEEEQSEYSLGGPITMTAIGGGTLLVSLYVLLVIEVADSACNANSTGDCDGDEGVTNLAYTAALVGTGLTVGGLVWLFNRIPPRRALGRQIDQLEKEKRYLRHQVSVAPAFGPGHAGLRLQMAF